jgi:hypothetical protein
MPFILIKDHYGSCDFQIYTFLGAPCEGVRAWWIKWINKIKIPCIPHILIRVYWGSYDFQMNTDLGALLERMGV